MLSCNWLFDFFSLYCSVKEAKVIFRDTSGFRKFKVYKWYWQIQCWWGEGAGNAAGDGLASHSREESLHATETDVKCQADGPLGPVVNLT